MRLGLRGQTRRVLSRRGIKPVQRVQLRYEWSYLLLAVDPMEGTLRWRWLERMNKEQLLPVMAEWRLECVVWDGAPAHKARVMSELSTKRLLLPSYSPELNPVERVFEEIRRHVEGRVYPDLASKRQAVEVYLNALAADPERVRRLCAWRWIQEALTAPR